MPRSKTSFFGFFKSFSFLDSKEKNIPKSTAQDASIQKKKILSLNDISTPYLSAYAHDCMPYLADDDRKPSSARRIRKHLVTTSECSSLTDDFNDEQSISTQSDNESVHPVTSIEFYNVEDQEIINVPINYKSLQHLKMPKRTCTM